MSNLGIFGNFRGNAVSVGGRGHVAAIMINCPFFEIVTVRVSCFYSFN